MKILKKLKKKFKFKVSTTIIAVALSSITFILIALFLIIFRVDDKHISFISFYDEPVEVRYSNFTIPLMPYDTAEITVNTKNPIIVHVFNKEGTKLEEVKAEDVGRNAQLFVFSLSPQKKYCGFASEAQIEQNSNITLVNKELISTEPKEYFKVDLDFVNYRYFYPGKAPSRTRVDNSKIVNYVLPINCSYINEDSKLANTIKVFQNYDPVEQRRYYEDVKKRISEAEEVDSIRGALPNKTSKYYVSEDEYVFMYE